jgi:hypothetical protein
VPPSLSDSVIVIPCGPIIQTSWLSFMMDVPHARQQLGSAVSVRHPGLVNQKLLLQNECLIAENRILRAYLPAHMRLSDPERSTLAEIGKRLTLPAKNAAKTTD